jgi:hypothetical protein
MSIPPFAFDLLLQLWFDSVMFCVLCFVFFFFACNKAQSSLFNLSIYILMLCEIFVLDLDIWVVDVNDILTFRSRRMSFGLRVLCSQGRGIISTYALDYVCLVQIRC